jgi:Ca-activated chloride channel family protein
MEIRYGNLNFLYLLLLVAALCVLVIWSFRRRRRLLERFAGEKLIERLATRLEGREYKVNGVLLLLGMSFMVLSLIEPKWGYHIEQVKRRGVDIVVAVDTSRSMLAEDVKPNRLGYAKREVEDLLNVLEGDRIAIVAFAGTAFAECPLTLDYAFARMVLNDIDTSTIPQGGTALAGAIQKSLEAFQDPLKKYKSIIILTDGEDHEGWVDQAVAFAKDRGVKIFVVGVGDTEGAFVPIEDERGDRTYIRESGEPVVSKLNPEMLEKIALATGGGYLEGGGPRSALEEIYRDHIAAMEEKELGTGEIKRYENRYQIPLLIGTVLIILHEGFAATFVEAVRRALGRKKAVEHEDERIESVAA